MDHITEYMVVVFIYESAIYICLSLLQVLLRRLTDLDQTNNQLLVAPVDIIRTTLFWTASAFLHRVKMCTKKAGIMRSNENIFFNWVIKSWLILTASYHRLY